MGIDLPDNKLYYKGKEVLQEEKVTKGNIVVEKENFLDLNKLQKEFADFETVPEVLDAEDMQLQTKLITICA